MGALVKKMYEQLRCVRGEMGHGVPGEEDGHGDSQPGDGDQRVPRYLQNPQTEEGQQVQDDGRRGGGEAKRKNEGEKPGSFGIKISQCLLPAIETSWQSNLTSYKSQHEKLIKCLYPNDLIINILA